MPDTFDKEHFTRVVVADRLVKQENLAITQENLAEQVKKKLLLSESNDFDLLVGLSNKLIMYTPTAEWPNDKKSQPVRLEDCSILDIEAVAKLLGFSTESYVTLLAKEGGYFYA